MVVLSPEQIVAIISDSSLDYWEDEGISETASASAGLDEADWRRVIEGWEGRPSSFQKRLAQLCGEVDRASAKVTLSLMLEQGDDSVVVASADSLRQLPTTQLRDSVSRRARARLEALAGGDGLDAQVARRLLEKLALRE